MENFWLYYIIYDVAMHNTILLFFLCRKSETAQASSDSVVAEQTQAPTLSVNAAINGPQSYLSSSATASGFTSLSVQVSRQL